MPKRHTIVTCNLIGIREKMNKSRKSEVYRLKRFPYSWQMDRYGQLPGIGMKKGIPAKVFF